MFQPRQRVPRPLAEHLHGSYEKTNARITVYRPERPNGTAAVICPGGGYGGLVIGPEGSGIAHWLNAHGVTGVVLEYRLPHGRPFVPLLDAQRAIRLVRSRSKELGGDPVLVLHLADNSEGSGRKEGVIQARHAALRATNASRRGDRANRP